MGQGTTTTIRYGPALPATCEPRDVYFKTGTDAGLYESSGTNSWRRVGAGGSSGGFSLTNVSTGSDVAPHRRAGTAGTLKEVTLILRRALTDTLTLVLYLDGVTACTINVPASTPVDSTVSITSFGASTVAEDSIFKLAITASDSSVDPLGVATVQMFWS